MTSIKTVKSNGYYALVMERRHETLASRLKTLVNGHITSSTITSVYTKSKFGITIETPMGGPSPDTSNDDLGSNESIHFSVRVLSEIYPLQGRKRCRALQKFEILEKAEGGVIWHDRSARSDKGDIPQDDATEYEQAMLHRWLDRDLAAREILGGQKASEAIAGSTLSPAPVVAQAEQSTSPSSQPLLHPVQPLPQLSLHSSAALSLHPSAALSPSPSEVQMSMPPLHT